MAHSTRPNVKVTMGEPQTEIPTGAKAYSVASHWFEVAEAAKQNTGMWCPFAFDGLTRSTLHAASSRVKRGLLKAFADESFEVKLRGEILWVRHIPKTSKTEWELTSK